MDKDEMIEEMSKIIDKSDEKCGNADCFECEYVNTDRCVYILGATELYNAGYRKVGEDEIVIKKSEYEVQAKEIKRLHKELKKAQRELNVRKDFWEDDFEERIENYGKQYYELGKRDTARDILQFIDSRLDIRRDCIFERKIYLEKGYKMAIQEIKMLIKAEYGIKLEEKNND